MEIGPYRLKDDATLIYNDGSWDEFANLMFVDNPVGTGFSSVDSDSYVHELPEMADQFIIFLERFFEIFPHYEQDDVSETYGSALCVTADKRFSYILLANPTPDNISLTLLRQY
jgi:carboxypeptidase C (cathepsin A)